MGLIPLQPGVFGPAAVLSCFVPSPQKQPPPAYSEAPCCILGCRLSFATPPVVDLAGGVLTVLPKHKSDILTCSPPSALRMLEEYVDLQPGDAVIQNGANSAVGQVGRRV